MSGESGFTDCPRCGGKMSTYVDWKPHDSVFGECLDCGFAYYTERHQLTLEEVNEKRKEQGMRPIKEFRKPTKEWLKYEGR